MVADAVLKSMSHEDWRWIEQGRIEGEERDRLTGLHNAERRGNQNGRREQALSDARNFLALHVASHEQIAQAVGLPLSEVEELAARM
jgi:hypothetical protein